MSVEKKDKYERVQTYNYPSHEFIYRASLVKTKVFQITFAHHS